MEFAGEVEEVGAAVQEFEAGDRVFGIKRYGANAEYLCIGERHGLARMPAGFTFEEAAAGVDGGCIALECLRRAGDLEGRSIVVYGASGSIGTAAVQLARHFGAHVTAVCNGKNVGLVRSLGADDVLDYEQEDFARSGRTYDVVFDSVGKLSYPRARRSLKPGGVWHLPVLALLTKWIGHKRVGMGVTRHSKEDVRLIQELLESGRYRPVIDRTYPLEDVVEAARYVETGQKTGNVVLTVA